MILTKRSIVIIIFSFILTFLQNLHTGYFYAFTFVFFQLARKGQHAVRDANVKHGTEHCIIEYEDLEFHLRDEKAQQSELDILNYLAGKKLADLLKKVPTEADVSNIPIIHTFLMRLKLVRYSQQYSLF